MSSDHDTRAKRDQHGTDAQHDKHVMTDGGDALPSGEEQQQEAIDAIQKQLDIQWSTNWSPLPAEAEQHAEEDFEHLNAAKEIAEADQ